MFASTPNRWPVYLALAGALHGSALLSKGCVHASMASKPPLLEKPADAIEVRLIPAPQVVAGSAPGGGATEPRSAPPVSALEQRVKPSAQVRPVERTSVREDHVAASHRPEDTNEPEPFATDMLASDLADTSNEVRPLAARRQILADHSQGEPQAGTLADTGSGANGGPGGLGHGKGGPGVVEQQFAFGGPVGAFRADVCFIEPTVRLLTDITSCVPVTTFFTSALNVAPRRFDQGFPGLARRTEWFAIKYTGKFRVNEDDSYTFRLLSDDGARLEIDGLPVLDNDGQHSPIAVSKNVRLSAGVHEFFVFYYQGPPDFVALQLFVKRFAEEEKLFGPVI